ncbi:MAG TPA: hypothetical protein VK760_03160 [Candidatus Acidoferrales bacterium]|jgi:hypothetical protein|nr:hypothetical protein [Candidatus Acidoferrales bacterium]
MDVLQLFSIANAPISNGQPSSNASQADKAKLDMAFIPVKTWNIERAQHVYRPGIALADNPDNADIAGPDSVYDYYV